MLWIPLAVAAGIGGLIAWSRTDEAPLTSVPGGLAWGKKVSPAFARKVIQIGRELQIDPSFLMAMMKHESGLNPCAHINKIGEGPKLRSSTDCNDIGPNTIGGGLIGFMRKTAKGMGIQLEDLLRLDGLGQLDYVREFYRRHRASGILPANPTMQQVFMSTFLPAYTKHANNPGFVLSRRGDKVYAYNPGTDRNKDGITTVGEAVARILPVLKAGQSPKNFLPSST